MKISIFRFEMNLTTNTNRNQKSCFRWDTRNEDLRWRDVKSRFNCFSARQTVNGASKSPPYLNKQLLGGAFFYTGRQERRSLKDSRLVLPTPFAEEKSLNIVAFSFTNYFIWIKKNRMFNSLIRVWMLLLSDLSFKYL